MVRRRVRPRPEAHASTCRLVPAHTLGRIDVLRERRQPDFATPCVYVRLVLDRVQLQLPRRFVVVKLGPILLAFVLSNEDSILQHRHVSGICFSSVSRCDEEWQEFNSGFMRRMLNYEKRGGCSVVADHADAWPSMLSNDLPQAPQVLGIHPLLLFP